MFLPAPFCWIPNSSEHFSLAAAPRAYNVANQYATRDIFEVLLATEAGEELLVLANHWPSRMYPNSEPLRIGLADFCRRLFVDRVRFPKNELFTPKGSADLPSRTALAKRWNQPVIVLGDFNDSPYDTSIEAVLGSTRERASVTDAPRLPSKRGISAITAYLKLHPRLYNPAWRLLSPDGEGPSGTCIYQGDWYMLDQALFSAGLLGEAGLRYEEGSLATFAEPSVLTRSGAPRGFDTRTSSGASDHLPLRFRLALT